MDGIAENSAQDAARLLDAQTPGWERGLSALNFELLRKALRRWAGDPDLKTFDVCWGRLYGVVGTALYGQLAYVLGNMTSSQVTLEFCRRILAHEPGPSAEDQDGYRRMITAMQTVLRAHNLTAPTQATQQPPPTAPRPARTARPQSSTGPARPAQPTRPAHPSLPLLRRAVQSLAHGDRTTAADTLRPLLADPDLAGDGIGNAVRLVAAALEPDEPDDEATVRAARELLDRHRLRWPEYSPVGAEPILAAASRTDFKLFADLAAAGERRPAPHSWPDRETLRRLWSRPVRAHVAEALHHASEGYTADALDALDAATAILDRLRDPYAAPLDGLTDQTEPAAALEEFTTRLRSHLTERLAAEAYARLERDGETHPWSAESVRLWELIDDSPAHSHHLAVAHHARAYELQGSALAGTQSATRARTEWTEALRHWAAVHGDDAYWQELHRRLEAATGTSVPVAVVDAVRGRLPRDLFEPHIALAARMHATDPRHAREHLAFVTSSGFPARDIAAARKVLVRDAVEAALAAVQQQEYAAASARLQPWLRLDPDNPDLLRTALIVLRHQVETEWFDARRPHQLVPLLTKMQGIEKRLGPDAAGQDRELAGELARLAFWRAVELHQRLARASRAEALLLVNQITHLADQAVELDPNLPLVGMYRELETFAPRMHALAARLTAAMWGGDSAVRRYVELAEASEHLEPVSMCHLVSALLDLDRPEPEDWTRAWWLLMEVREDPSEEARRCRDEVTRFGCILRSRMVAAGRLLPGPTPPEWLSRPNR
ncbi:hypothetical protein [Streptomyces sp. NPDC048825]|uniref:hypothetical protein n=1 Tax=Streptomyces sp. NPDC048825 TaxID=3365592 RepID=UPI0037189122